MLATTRTLHVGSVVIDCNDFTNMLEFWRSVLGYEIKHLVEDDFAILADPDRKLVNVSIQKVPEPRSGKNRLHLDLYCRDRGREVRRVTTLGAKVFPREPEPDEDFVVLEDPEGNLFCLVG